MRVRQVQAEEERDRLKAEVERLKTEVSIADRYDREANAKMLARQCDLARQAETDVAALLRTYAEQSEVMKQLRRDLSKAMAHIRDMACAADVREMDLAVCKAEMERLASMTRTLVDDMRDLVGIAERGAGRSIHPAENLRVFVLACVEKLESEREALKAEVERMKAELTSCQALALAQGIEIARLTAEIARHEQDIDAAFGAGWIASQRIPPYPKALARFKAERQERVQNERA